ncbi:MAG: hypothetical protein IJW55_04040 [Clostridia bacterium]|nr:hypothetical protein [Clostridia bacterium]
MQKLNAKETAVLDCIRRSIAENGYAPSVRDIGEVLGYNSTSTVQMYLDRLETYGYLRRNGGKSRSITLCRENEPRRIPLLHADASLDGPLTRECFAGELDFCYCGDLPEDAEIFACRLSGAYEGEIAVVARGTDLPQYAYSLVKGTGGFGICRSEACLNEDRIGFVISLFSLL